MLPCKYFISFMEKRQDRYLIIPRCFSVCYSSCLLISWPKYFLSLSSCSCEKCKDGNKLIVFLFFYSCIVEHHFVLYIYTYIYSFILHIHPNTHSLLFSFFFVFMWKIKNKGSQKVRNEINSSNIYVCIWESSDKKKKKKKKTKDHEKC